MAELVMDGFTDLSAAETETVSGGTPIKYTLFFFGCFMAGFEFGYNELGPSIFGE